MTQQLHQPQIELSGQAQLVLMQFSRLSSWWGLNRQEEAALLGLPERSMPVTLRSLTPALQRRIEALLAVWVASREIDQGGGWLRTPSRLCGGHTPLSVMLDCPEGVSAVRGALIDQKADPRAPH